MTMIKHAQRCEKISFPRSTSPRTLAGLRYERQVIKALKKQFPDLEHNPWFEYFGEGYDSTKVCSPDALLFYKDNNDVIVVEIKYTYTPQALEKLTALYCPVVALATGRSPSPLVIYKIATPMTPIGFPCFQWRGNGPLGFTL